MEKSDWSQFIPDLIVGLIVLLVGGLFAYVKSSNLRMKIQIIFSKLHLPIVKYIDPLKKIMVIILVFAMFVIIGNWRNILLGIILLALGIVGNEIFLKGIDIKRKISYYQIKLFPGIGNTTMSKKYIDPPSGRINLNNIPFLFEPEDLIFDTAEAIRYYSRKEDGSIEVEIKLNKPINKINKLYILINSGNSKESYKNKVIGDINFIFTNAPTITEQLILGNNIREWCPGNQGNYIREAINPRLKMGVWNGLAKNGANAVIDCLEIDNYNCLKSEYLEKIYIIHKKFAIPPDQMGVQFSIFGIVVEIQ